MNVYTIEDLEFMGIGRVIVMLIVRREGRGDRTPPKPFITRKQGSSCIIPFTSPSISLSLKGWVTGFEYASMIYGLPD